MLQIVYQCSVFWIWAGKALHSPEVSVSAGSLRRYPPPGSPAGNPARRCSLVVRRLLTVGGTADEAERGRGTRQAIGHGPVDRLSMPLRPRMVATWRRSTYGVPHVRKPVLR